MSKYKKKLDEIEFSFSSQHQYENCEYAFYLNKICDADKESNAFAEIGKYGHELNEKIFNGSMSVQEALDDCVENFEEHVISYISDASKEKKYLSLCNYLADFDESYADKYEVIGVEVEFHWKIGKYKCVGYADLILKEKETGKIILIDHKSAPHFMKKDGTPLKNQTDNFYAYRNQMYMYADAMKNKYGYCPDLIVWSHFLDDGAVTIIPFDEQEYKDAMQWVKTTIRRIYKDEKFAARENYMLCNQLCDFRNICEYKGMSEWERDA